MFPDKWQRSSDFNCAVDVQHWDPEEGTVCPFGLEVQVVVVSASLLVVATMFEWAKRVQ